MPNWMYNKVVIRLKNNETNVNHLHDLLNSVKGNDCVFDFNKIVPRPKELLLTECGSRTDKGMELWREALHKANKLRTYELDPDEYPEGDIATVILGKQALDNIDKYGYSTWYDWSLANWGTKWNSVESDLRWLDERSVEIRFRTAWSGPEPIIRKLAKLTGSYMKFDWYTCEEQMLAGDCFKYTKRPNKWNVHKERLFQSEKDDGFREYCLDMTGIDIEEEQCLSLNG